MEYSSHVLLLNNFLTSRSYAPSRALRSRSRIDTIPIPSFGGIRHPLLIRSDPPPESNCHQTTSRNLKTLENDHWDLNLRRRDSRKADEQDIRERHSHCRSLGRDAISHRDGIFFTKPEYGQRNADEGPDDVEGDGNEDYEDHAVRFHACKCAGFEGLVEGLPDDDHEGYGTDFIEFPVDEDLFRLGGKEVLYDLAHRLCDLNSIGLHTLRLG